MEEDGIGVSTHIVVSESSYTVYFVHIAWPICWITHSLLTFQIDQAVWPMLGGERAAVAVPGERLLMPPFQVIRPRGSIGYVIEHPCNWIKGSYSHGPWHFYKGIEHTFMYGWDSLILGSTVMAWFPWRGEREAQIPQTEGREASRHLDAVQNDEP